MDKLVIVIKIVNTDTAYINISGCEYIIFTLSHHNLIIVETSNKDNLILLLNREYPRDVISDKFQKIIDVAAKVSSNDEFISKMDTYIDLNSCIHNETIKEILDTCKIILKEYNL